MGHVSTRMGHVSICLGHVSICMDHVSVCCGSCYSSVRQPQCIKSDCHSNSVLEEDSCHGYIASLGRLCVTLIQRGNFFQVNWIHIGAPHQFLLLQQQVKRMQVSRGGVCDGVTFTLHPFTSPL